MVTVGDQAGPASKDQVKTGYLVYGPGSPVFFAISAVYNFLWTRLTILQTPDRGTGKCNATWAMGTPDFARVIEGVAQVEPDHAGGLEQAAQALE